MIKGTRVKVKTRPSLTGEIIDIEWGHTYAYGHPERYFVKHDGNIVPAKDWYDADELERIDENSLPVGSGNNLPQHPKPPSQSSEPGPPVNAKCECGAEAAKTLPHYKWCPKAKESR